MSKSKKFRGKPLTKKYRKALVKNAVKFFVSLVVKLEADHSEENFQKLNQEWVTYCVQGRVIQQPIMDMLANEYKKYDPNFTNPTDN